MQFEYLIDKLNNVNKVKVYKTSKHYIESPDISVITSKLTDVKWELIKEQLSHYLLKDLPFEFWVTNTNQWDPHPLKPTSITGSPERYLQLAESVDGPQIISHKNTIATQFYIMKEQAETITLLNNFIKYYVDKLFNNEKVDMTVLQANTNSNLESKH